MAKKITLASLAAQMAKGFAPLGKRINELDARMEKGFGAVADDLSKLATKEQVIELATQVNSIETQLRGMKHGKLETRVADLEEEVFASRDSPLDGKHARPTLRVTVIAVGELSVLPCRPGLGTHAPPACSIDAVASSTRLVEAT